MTVRRAGGIPAGFSPGLPVIMDHCEFRHCELTERDLQIKRFVP